MKKTFTAIALACALTASVAAPAAARAHVHPSIKDGSAGYALGCAVMWAFGYTNLCMELQ